MGCLWGDEFNGVSAVPEDGGIWVGQGVDGGYG